MALATTASTLLAVYKAKDAGVTGDLAKMAKAIASMDCDTTTATIRKVLERSSQADEELEAARENYAGYTQVVLGQMFHHVKTTLKAKKQATDLSFFLEYKTWDKYMKSCFPEYSIQKADSYAKAVRELDESGLKYEQVSGMSWGNLMLLMPLILKAIKDGESIDALIERGTTQSWRAVRDFVTNSGVYSITHQGSGALGGKSLGSSAAEQTAPALDKANGVDPTGSTALDASKATTYTKAHDDQQAPVQAAGWDKIEAGTEAQADPQEAAVTGTEAAEAAILYLKSLTCADALALLDKIFPGQLVEAYEALVGGTKAQIKPGKKPVLTVKT